MPQLGIPTTYAEARHWYMQAGYTQIQFAKIIGRSERYLRNKERANAPLSFAERSSILVISQKLMNPGLTKDSV